MEYTEGCLGCVLYILFLAIVGGILATGGYLALIFIGFI